MVSILYLALFTDPEKDSCFSIYQISWIKITKELFVNQKRHLVGTLFIIYHAQKFRGFCQVHFYDVVSNFLPNSKH